MTVADHEIVLQHFLGEAHLNQLGDSFFGGVDELRVEGELNEVVELLPGLGHGECSVGLLSDLLEDVNLS